MERPFNIRPGNGDDALAIGRILVETWRATFRGLLDDAYLDGMTLDAQAIRQARRMKAAEVGYHVAVDGEDGLVIGFANFGPARGKVPAGVLELYELYVGPQSQNNGAGKALVKAAARSSIEREATGLFAWVLAGNPNRGFYERLSATVAANGTVDVGGRRYEQLAYLWRDLPRLVEDP